MKTKAFLLDIAALLVGLLLLGDTGQRHWVGRALALVRGNATYQAGAYGDAEVWFRKALVAKPGLCAVQYNLGNALCQQGRYAEAAQCYQRALPACPAGLQAQAWVNLGHAYYQAGRVPASYDAYRHALLLRPADEAVRQDFLLVQAQLAAKQKAGPPRPKPNPAAPDEQKQAQRADRKSDQQDQKNAPGQPAATPTQKFSEQEMQEVFSTISQQENQLRGSLNSSRQQAINPASDEKDY